MLTVLGVCLTIAGAAGLGISLCEQQRQRMKELFLAEKFMVLAAGEISYGRTGMPALFMEVGARTGGLLGEALIRVGSRLQDTKGETMDAIWREEMWTYLKRSSLEKQERDLLLSFSDQMGFLDKDRQREAVERLGEELGNHARLLEQQLKSWEKMTMALCLSGGIAAVILLV